MSHTDTSILMVCLGNICRSPMAEGIMRYEMEKSGITARIDSAGTSSWHSGEPPDNRAIDNMHHNGIDISMLRARQFKVQDFQHFDRIYVMDVHNYNDVLSLAPDRDAAAKVQMIMNMVTPGVNQSVPDPYYGGDEGFQQVFDMLTLACRSIIQDLQHS